MSSLEGLQNPRAGTVRKLQSGPGFPDFDKHFLLQMPKASGRLLFFLKKLCILGEHVCILRNGIIHGNVKHSTQCNNSAQVFCTPSKKKRKSLNYSPQL